MHWRRKHSGYWISFQTNKEKIFQSWNENLINVSRSSYKCTFWETLQNDPSRVLLTRPLQSRKSVDKSPKNIFCGCFGTDMLFPKLDTFYGPAASYIQFPNTHISTLKKHRDLCFSFTFNAIRGMRHSAVQSNKTFLQTVVIVIICQSK